MKVRILNKECNRVFDIPEPVYVMASIAQITFIDNLLLTSVIGYEEQNKILRELNDYTEGEAEQMIGYLKDNQINNILAGGNYTQTDIKKALGEL